MSVNRPGSGESQNHQNENETVDTSVTAGNGKEIDLGSNEPTPEALEAARNAEALLDSFENAQQQSQPQPEVQPQTNFYEEPQMTNQSQNPNQNQQQQQNFQGTGNNGNSNTKATDANPFRGFQSPFAEGLDVETGRIMNIFEKVKEQFKDNREVQAITMLPISRRDTNSFGGLVMAVCRTVNGKKFVAEQTWILEKTRSTIDPLKVPVANGGTVEVPVATSFAFNRRFKEAVRQAIQNKFGADSRIIPTGTQIFTREMEIRENDTAALLPFLDSSHRAISAALGSFDTSKQFNLDSIKNSSKYHLTSVTSTNQLLRHPNEIPVRSDIVIEMSSVTNSNQLNSGINGAEVEVPSSELIVRTACYVNAMYAYRPAGPNNPQSWYVPRITISQIYSEMGRSSLQFSLLGIGNSFALGRNQAYGIQYRAPYGQANDKINLKDVGAIGYQVDGLAGDKGAAMLDVANDDSAIRRLVQQTFADPVYSLETEETTPDAWLTSIYRIAAQQTEDGKKARIAIINAANTLTNGHFKRIFTERLQQRGMNVTDLASVPLLRDTNDLNFVGYYVVDNIRRPLSEFDQLALLNILGPKGESSYETIRNFQATYVANPSMQNDIQARLDRRFQIIKQFASDAVFKGYSNILDFMPIFIESLVAAIAATQVQINANASGLRDSQFQTQTFADWESVMTNPAQQQFMFQSGGFNNNGFNGTTFNGGFSGGFNGFGGVTF